MSNDVNRWEVGYHCSNKATRVGPNCSCIGGGDHIVHVFGPDTPIDNYYIGIFLRRNDNDVNSLCRSNEYKSNRCFKEIIIIFLMINVYLFQYFGWMQSWFHLLQYAIFHFQYPLHFSIIIKTMDQKGCFGSFTEVRRNPVHL